jgi:hypothetical protein
MDTDCGNHQCEADGELNEHTEDQKWSTVHQSILSIAHTNGKKKAIQTTLRGFAALDMHASGSPS